MPLFACVLLECALEGLDTTSELTVLPYAFGHCVTRFGDRCRHVVQWLGSSAWSDTNSCGEDQDTVGRHFFSCLYPRHA